MGETRWLEGGCDSLEVSRNRWWNFSGFVRLCNSPRYLVAIQGITWNAGKTPVVILPGSYGTPSDKEVEEQENTGAYPWFILQWNRAKNNCKTPTMQIIGALAFSEGGGKTPRIQKLLSQNATEIFYHLTNTYSRQVAHAAFRMKSLTFLEG